MSSNMYGITCMVPWDGRVFDVQIVYVGTEGDDEESRMQATAGWETEAPVALARYELDHRDWTKQWHGEARLIVYFCCGGWLDTDPQFDPTWRPLLPSDRQVLEAIASGNAQDIVHGWDT